jgi:hypothetical protein
MRDDVAVDGVRRPAGRTDAAMSSWRKGRCVELAMAGHSYDDIAEQVGYANRGTAWRTVQNALSERKVQSVDEYRQLELARLDALTSAHWGAAISGTDLKAAEMVLEVSAQRVKLLGLDSVSEQPTLSRTLVIGGSSEEYVSGLKAISGMTE